MSLSSTWAQMLVCFIIAILLALRTVCPAHSRYSPSGSVPLTEIPWPRQGTFSEAKGHLRAEEQPRNQNHTPGVGQHGGSVGLTLNEAHTTKGQSFSLVPISLMTNFCISCWGYFRDKRKQCLLSSETRAWSAKM